MVIRDPHVLGTGERAFRFIHGAIDERAGVSLQHGYTAVARRRGPCHSASVRLFLCLCLAFGACGDDDSDDDALDMSEPRDLAGAEPRVDIGTGVTTFVPIADGADVELVNGPQGGWHVDVTLRLYDVNPQELTMRIEGYDVASGMPVGVPIERILTERRVQPEADHWLRLGDQLIFAIEGPEEVTDTDVRIEVRITTPEGATATAEKVVHVIDEEP